MAIIRFTDRKVIKNKEREKEIDYKEKIRNHKFMIFYRGILLIMLILALTGSCYFHWKTKTYTDSIVLSSVDNKILQSNQFMRYGNKILLYGKDGASCIDEKGKTIWNVTYEMQNPTVEMCENMIAIGDYNARTIYLLDDKGKQGEITVSMPIYQFCVAQNGVVCVELNDGKVTWIYLYDKTGKELAYFKTTMQKSGFPIDLTISPNGQLVGVSYLYVSNGEMKTSIGFYNFGDVGQNATDNYVSGYDYQNIIVPDLQFMDSKTCFAVSDDRLMIYSGNQKPVNIGEHLLDGEIKSIYHNQNYIGLVFVSDSADNRYRLEVYGKSGNKVTSVEFDIDYSDIIFDEDYIYIYNESNCFISHIDGTVKYDGKLVKTAELIIPSGKRNRLTVANRNSLDLIELQ